jgi:hypothetical protein
MLVMLLSITQSVQGANKKREAVWKGWSFFYGRLMKIVSFTTFPVLSLFFHGHFGQIMELIQHLLLASFFLL